MARANGDRIKSAALVAVVHALLGLALVAGLRMDVAARADAALKMFDIAPVVPPPLPVEEIAPAPAAVPEAEGAAAPPGLRAEPSPVVAPPPKIKLQVPPPVIAAPAPGTGSDTSAGASDIAGPGPGAGGEGTGTGTGRSGDGSGGGGGVAARARHVAGAIRSRDHPRAGARGSAQGTVIARLSIGADGRVEACAVTLSSGDAALDAATCRLIRARFRYEPARDAAGRPVADVTGWKQEWWLD